MTKDLTSTDVADGPEPKPQARMEPLVRWLDKKKAARKKARKKTWESENNPASTPTALASGAGPSTPIDTPSTPVETVDATKLAPELSSPSTPVDTVDATKLAPELSSQLPANELPSATQTLAAQTDNELAPSSASRAAKQEVVEQRDEPKAPQGTTPPSRDDALFLLWDEAYDALLNDKVPGMRRFHQYLSRYWSRNIDADRGWRQPGFESTNATPHWDEMRRILEYLLDEPDPGRESGGDSSSSSETKPTSLYKFKTAIRQAALRESQRAAAVIVSTETPPFIPYCGYSWLCYMSWACNFTPETLRCPQNTIY